MAAEMTRAEWERRWQRTAIDGLLAKIEDTEPARLLEDLWAARLDGRPMTARAVAERLYGPQPPSSDPSSRVRTTVNLLRSAIASFEQTTDGKRARFELKIEGRPYQLVFVPRDLPIKRFWQPHFGREETCIVNTAPVFLRDLRRRTMIRQLDLNLETGWERHVERWISRLEDAGIHAEHAEQFKSTLAELLIGNFETRRPYTPIGEAKCVFGLARCFDRMGIPTSQAFAHETTLKPSCDYVLIGNARTNEILRTEQTDERCNLMVMKTSVYVRDHKVEDCTDNGHFHDKIQRGGRVFALISRSTHASGRTMTVLGANHSWAFAKIGELLTHNEGIEQLLHAASAPNWGELPSSFGIVLEMFLSREAAETVSGWRVATARGFTTPTPC